MRLCKGRSWMCDALKTSVIRMHCHFVTHTFLTDSAVMFQGAADPKKVDPRLLTPAVQSFCCCLPAKFRRCIQCNIDRTQVGSARHFVCIGTGVDRWGTGGTRPPHFSGWGDSIGIVPPTFQFRKFARHIGSLNTPLS